MKAFMSWVRAMLVGLVLSCLSTLPSQAAAQCGEVGAMLRALATKYHEAEVWRGVAGDGLFLLITANPDGSTWTALRLAPEGQACLLVAGPNWQPGNPAPLGEEG